MSNSALRVQTARVAAAVAIARTAGCGAGARAASENLLEGLPYNLKPRDEGADLRLQPSAYDNFRDASAAVEVVPLRNLIKATRGAWR